MVQIENPSVKAKDFDPSQANATQIAKAIDTYSQDISQAEKKWSYVSGAWAGLKSLALYSAIEAGTNFALRSLFAQGGTKEVLSTVPKNAGGMLASVGRYIKANPLSTGLVGAVALWDAYSGVVEAQENLQNEKDAAIGRGVRELKHRSTTEVASAEPETKKVLGKYTSQVLQQAEAKQEAHIGRG